MDYHTWTDGETYREHDGVMVKRKCVFCGHPARQRMATQRKAQTFEVTEEMQGLREAEAEGVGPVRVMDPRVVESIRRKDSRAEIVIKIGAEDIAAAKAEAAQRKPRSSPSGKSRASALPLEVRRQVQKLRETSRPDEVAELVMEQGVGRKEPLVPRSWSVQGLGPMHPVSFQNDSKRL